MKTNKDYEAEIAEHQAHRASLLAVTEAQQTAIEALINERDALRAELASTAARNVELEHKRVLLEIEVDRLTQDNLDLIARLP